MSVLIRTAMTIWSRPLGLLCIQVSALVTHHFSIILPQHIDLPTLSFPPEYGMFLVCGLKMVQQFCFRVND